MNSLIILLIALIKNVVNAHLLLLFKISLEKLLMIMYLERGDGGTFVGTGSACVVFLSKQVAAT